MENENTVKLIQEIQNDFKGVVEAHMNMDDSGPDKAFSILMASSGTTASMLVALACLAIREDKEESFIADLCDSIKRTATEELRKRKKSNDQVFVA